MLYRASAPFITYWLTAQKVLNTKWLFSQIELDVDAVAMLFLNIKLTEGLEVITKSHILWSNSKPDGSWETKKEIQNQVKQGVKVKHWAHSQNWTSWHSVEHTA